MTYADNHKLLILAKDSRANSVNIDLDMGELRVSVPVAIQVFKELSPGEGFQVISINFE